jgi:DNA-binding NarL/FixJ family response regulator
VIRVLLADDQALVRAGFKALLDAQDDIEVVGEAADGAEAVELALRERPDVVVMDIRMPVLDGIAATERITAEHPGTRVLILTTFDLDEYVYDALRAGASGFLLKDTPPDELIAAIHVVARGDALIAPAITRRLISEFARRPSPRGDSRLEELTAREREVLGLVARGMSNAEIAAELVLGDATIKTHVGTPPRARDPETTSRPRPARAAAAWRRPGASPCRRRGPGCRWS